MDDIIKPTENKTGKFHVGFLKVTQVNLLEYAVDIRNTYVDGELSKLKKIFLFYFDKKWMYLN